MAVFAERSPSDAKVVRMALGSAFVALFLGGLMGLIQALHRTGYLRIIDDSTYYTVLTLHGVALVLLFTIFFLVGFFHWAVVDSLDRTSESTRFTQLWYALMSLGAAMSSVTILGWFVGEVDVSADVREELDRLDAHLASARELLDEGGVIGRRLDFLCQELNREANTLCSKAQDVALTRTGLALKNTVEQLREQIQNIE